MSRRFSVAVLILAAGYLATGCSAIPKGCPNWPNKTAEGGRTGPATINGMASEWPDDMDIVVPIHTTPPRYPRSAQQKGITGYVEIEAQIGRDGRVRSAKVIKSEPPEIFDDSALRAYKQWRYCPLAEEAPDYPDPVKVKLSFEL